jgi:hypothetical protein
MNGISLQKVCNEYEHISNSGKLEELTEGVLEATECTGYVQGVADQLFYEGQITKSGKSISPYVAYVHAYLEAHPDRLRESAYVLTKEALIKAYSSK